MKLAKPGLESGTGFIAPSSESPPLRHKLRKGLTHCVRPFLLLKRGGDSKRSKRSHKADEACEAGP
jgi:hypothetical protein